MRSLLLFVLLTLCLQASSQSDFEHITSENGLSQNNITFIFQDSKGFMWFGTYDGLNRYDGLKFVTYQRTTPMNNPIGSNLPFCMTEDSHGNFWIGTSDNGMWFFDRKKEEFHKIPDQTNGNTLFISPQIQKLYLDHKGLLWVASKSGLSILDINSYYKGRLQGKLFSTKSKEPDQYSDMNLIYLIREDSKQQMWLSTNNGFFKAKLDHELHLVLSKISDLPSTYVHDMIELPSGYIVSFYNGVYFFQQDDNSGTITIKKLVDTLFDTMVLTSKGSIFCGNINALYEYNWNENKKELELIQNFRSELYNTKSINNNNISKLYEDRSGLLWVGTNGGGLNKLDLNEKKFHQVSHSVSSNSLPNNLVRSIFEDKDENLWVGTDKGISCLPRGKENQYSDSFVNKLVAPYENAQNYVYCIGELSQERNAVILGVGYPVKLAIARLSGNKKIVIQQLNEITANPVFTLFVDRDNYIWLGTYGDGMYKTQYDKSSKTLVVKNHYSYNAHSKGSLSSDIIRSIIEDAEGNILIGTDNGLNFLSKSEKSKNDPFFFVEKNVPDNDTSLPHNYILTMKLDSKGRSWIGTMGGGLALLDPAGNRVQFKCYTSKNGLPNDVIKAIEEDDEGYLWISTNKGLTRFNPDTEEIRNYSISDGLQGYEFSELSSCKKVNGELLFGGVNGFNIFNPKEIEDNPYGSKVEFTDLFILNDKIVTGEKYRGRVLLKNAMPSTDSIEIKYAENSFSIGFTALHFVAPEKIQYKYMLEGFDHKWNQVNSLEPRAKYTNIPPGDYTLRVLATNNDGVWSTVPSVFYIRVIPPFWRSVPALVLYMLIFVVLMIFFRRYSVIAVTKKNELLMEHFEQEKMEELVQMKLQFFTNISHEFRTPLTLIQSPLEKLMDKDEQLNEEDRQKNYAMMHRNVGMLNRLITQLMEFRKLERGKMPLEASRGNVIDLVKEVFDAFGEIAESKNIRFQLNNDYPFIELWFDYYKLEKVLYNLLSNAFKFTPQGGEVAIHVTEVEMEDKEWVRIDIIDNGPGIEKNKIPFLFDRFYQAGSHKLSKVSGTGIGLAFSKNLIHLHHGKIEVESKQNVETKFSIYLIKGKMHLNQDEIAIQPISQDLKKEVLIKDYHIESQEANAEEKPDLDKSKELVLIVEDNYDIQELIKNNLGKDYNCLQAMNGKEGLELCRKFSPDIIISDVMMPEMDGFEMCTKIQEDEQICHIPIVILSAKTADEDKLTGLSEGAVAYISKPFSIDVLNAQVKSILESRKLVQQKYMKKIELEPDEITFTSIDKKLIERLLRVVEENIGNSEFTVVQLAREVGISPAILNKKLKALLGQTANVFIRTIRLKRAAQLLKLDRLSVTDVVYEVGFNDLKYFRECFRKQFDVTPSEYIRMNKNEVEE